MNAMFACLAISAIWLSQASSTRVCRRAGYAWLGGAALIALLDLAGAGSVQ